jgi:hypothetical protein
MKTKIFFAGDLDDPNQLEIVQQISICAQQFPGAIRGTWAWLRSQQQEKTAGRGPGGFGLQFQQL